MRNQIITAKLLVLTTLILILKKLSKQVTKNLKMSFKRVRQFHLIIFKGSIVRLFHHIKVVNSSYILVKTRQSSPRQMNLNDLWKKCICNQTAVTSGASQVSIKSASHLPIKIKILISSLNKIIIKANRSKLAKEKIYSNETAQS